MLLSAARVSGGLHPCSGLMAGAAEVSQLTRAVACCHAPTLAGTRKPEAVKVLSCSGHAFPT